MSTVPAPMTAAPTIPAQSRPLTWTDGLDRLREQVQGVVLRGDAPEAAAEVATWNVATTHQPAVVVGAACAEDVAAAVRWAVDHEMPVGVQATGHGAHVPVDGLLVTTSRMNGVHVDPVAREATFGAGARWNEVVAASAPHGLAPLSGSSSSVGAVGYSLGGGLGPLGRKYGFAADLVRSVELVTADGVIRHVDAQSEPDLFWAVRGGKGNFGIVTTMTARLVPVSDFYVGSVFFDGADAQRLLHMYRQWAATLPEEATTSIALMRVPPLPFLPEPIRGRFVVHLRYAHCGDPVEAEALFTPMVEAGQVLLADIGSRPFTESDSLHKDPVDPLPYHERVATLRELGRDTIEAILDVAGPDAELPLVMVEIRQLGGALGRQPQVPNAVPGRNSAYSVFALGALMPEIAEIVPAACDRVLEALTPWRDGGGLANMLGNVGPEATLAAYGKEAAERLMIMKLGWDPANVFRFGYGIR